MTRRSNRSRGTARVNMGSSLKRRSIASFVGSTVKRGSLGGGGSPPIPPDPELDLAWAAATYDPTTFECLAQRKGQGSPAFTNSEMLLPDFEGVYKTIPANSPTWHGARVVTNQAYYSNDPSQQSLNIYWVQSASSTLTGGVAGPFGGNDAWTFAAAGLGNRSLYQDMRTKLDDTKIVTGADTVVSIWMRSTNGSPLALRMHVARNSQQSVTIDGTWRRYSFIDTDAASSNNRCGPNLINDGDSVDIYGLQVEYVTGTSQTVASEYIDTTASATSITKYYANLNGNTVTNNVVTEAVGPIIGGVADDTLVNLVINSNDLTQNLGFANTTQTFDQVGITGEPNTATKVEDTSNTVAQYLSGKNATLSGANTTVVCRVFVKKDTTTDYSQFTWQQTGGTAKFTIRFNLGTSDGTWSISGNADAGAIEDAGDWWIIYCESTNDGGNTTIGFSALNPVSSTTLGGVQDSSLTGHIIVGNYEVFEGKTIADIRGKQAMVTEGTTGGTPTAYGEIPSLYAAPALTNLMTYSRDLTGTGWSSNANGTATYDQVGLTGEPNTASLVDATGADGFATYSYTPTGTNTMTVLLRVLKDNNTSRYPSIFASGNIFGHYHIDTQNGTLVPEGVLADATEVVSNGLWWDIYLQKDLTGGAFQFRINGARGGATQGTYDASATGSVVVGNLEVFEGKTIAEVKGSAPIVTEGSTVTTSDVLIDYDTANHAADQGVYYAEFISLAPNTGWVGPLASGGSGARILYHNPTVNVLYTDAGGSPQSDVTVAPEAYENWTKGAVAYNEADQLYIVNKNGTYAGSDSSYNPPYTTGSPIRVGGNRQADAPLCPNLTRNIQRWDLPYADAKAKIDELML